MTLGCWYSPQVVLWGGLLLLGLIADLFVLLYVAFSSIRLDRVFHRLSTRPLGARDVLTMTALFTLLYAVVAFGLPPSAPHSLRLIGNTLAFHWMVLVYVLTRMRRNQLRWADLFGRPHPLDAGIGILIYLAAIPIIAIHTTVIISFLRLIGVPPTMQPTVVVLATSRSPLFILYLLVLGGFIGPLAEEIFFRGYLMPLLMTRTSPLVGLVASSLIFAAAHLHLTSTPTLFVVALACGIAYLVTGSLVSAIVLHAAFNIVNMISTLWLIR